MSKKYITKIAKKNDNDFILTLISLEHYLIIASRIAETF